MQVKSR